MFDPHRTRYNDRRYYTRKGQVIQAKRTEVPFLIEPNRVDAYKTYILKNHIVTSADLPSATPIVDSIKFSDDSNTYPISSMNTSTQTVTITGPSQTIALSKAEDPYYNIVYIIYCPSANATYSLPAGSRYKTFQVVGGPNDSFQLKQGDTTITEFAQTHVPDPESDSIPRVTANAIRNNAIQISDLPA